MGDGITTEDRRRINTAHAFELDGLARRYGTTPERVRDTVLRVGVLRRKVEAELQRDRANPIIVAPAKPR